MKFNIKKIKFAILGIVLVSVVPICATRIVESSIPSKANNDGWLGFIGSYSGSIIGAIVSVCILIVTLKSQERSREKEYKVQNRCILDTSECNKVGIKLEGQSLSGRAKIAGTDNYSELKNFDKENGYGSKINYLRINNLGPELVIDIRAEISLKRGNETKTIEFYFPSMCVDEELYICVSFLDWDLDDQKTSIGSKIKKIIIKYKTRANEEMKYESNGISSDTFYEKGGKYESYLKNEGKATIWYPIE